MVEIPDDVAKDYAADLRKFGPRFTKVHALADLLDPQPPTLREQVTAVLDREPQWTDEPYTSQELADAVLAVVADWLVAQPLDDPLAPKAHAQRDHDVRLLRGES